MSIEPSFIRHFFSRSQKKIDMHYATLEASGAKPDIHSDFSRLARMLTGKPARLGAVECDADIFIQSWALVIYFIFGTK